jgi:class 3 adenylate cyclase/tetratricopeptide (TPR) repeat protein
MKKIKGLTGICSLLIILALGLPLSAQQPDTNRVVRDVKADSLLQAASDKLTMNLGGDASELAYEAYSLFSRSDDHEGMGDALVLIGGGEEKAGKPGLALRNYFTALREYEWIGLAVKQAGVSKRIGDIFINAGIYGKAIEYYGKAMDYGVALMTDDELLHLKEGMAGAYLGMKEYGKALAVYEEIYDRYKGRYAAAFDISILNQLTACLYALEQYDKALEYNEKALVTSRLAGDKLQEMAALNNLGYASKYLGNQNEALDYFREATELGTSIGANPEQLSVSLVNMAIVAQNMGDRQRSLEYFFQAYNIAAGAQLHSEMARISHLISLTYFNTEDYYNAGEYNREALRLAQKAGDADLLAMTRLQASNIAAALYDYELSLAEYRRYLDIRDSLETAARLREQNLASQQYLVERTEKELDEMIYTRKVERLELSQLRLEAKKKEQEMELLVKTGELQEATIQNQELEKNRALQELLLAEEKLAAERKDREIKDLKVQQQLQESELRRNELEQARQQQEITVLTQEKEISELNLQKVRARNRFMAGLIVLGLVILVIIYRSWRYARKINRVLKDQRNKIQQQKEAIESQYDLIKIEREKSEKLLLNILPEETAAELKEKGYASPRQYELVTVLFTDFVGFTMVAEKMTPQEIVRELDYCFMEFDRIIDRHNLEKIKTIGDSYMCAGGIPVANDSNPFDVVEAALEIRDFMDKTRKAREDSGEAYWQLRIGVHTGPVVAGVVGKNKFAYDIWGDAVNTASRMESSGEAGKVNISGRTYEIIKEHFDCSYRGKIKAKNKGEVDMYFVKGRL